MTVERTRAPAARASAQRPEVIRLNTPPRRGGREGSQESDSTPAEDDAPPLPSSAPPPLPTSAPPGGPPPTREYDWEEPAPLRGKSVLPVTDLDEPLMAEIQEKPAGASRYSDVHVHRDNNSISVQSTTYEEKSWSSSADPTSKEFSVFLTGSQSQKQSVEKSPSSGRKLYPWEQPKDDADCGVKRSWNSKEDLEIERREREIIENLEREERQKITPAKSLDYGKRDFKREQEKEKQQEVVERVEKDFESSLQSTPKPAQSRKSLFNLDAERAKMQQWQEEQDKQRQVGQRSTFLVL